MESGDGLNRAPQTRGRPADVERVGAVESSAQVICHLAENSREVFWLSDWPERNVLYVNQAFESVFGRPVSSALGAPFGSFVHEDDRQAFQRLLDDRAESGYDSTHRIVRPNGTVRWVRDRGFPIRDEEGCVRRITVISEDITEYKRAGEEIRESREEMRRLTTRLVDVREEERAGIAREVHDQIGQALTSLKLDLAWLEKRIHPLPPGLKDHIGAMMAVLDESVQTARSISARLRPAVLDHLGLEAAIEAHAREFERRTRCRVNLNLRAFGLGLEHQRDTAVFRILQEALTNIARHAEASSVDIDLSIEGSSLVLTIQDDGRGITAAELGSRNALGILGMRERARSNGGMLQVDSGPGGGTLVRLRMPLAAAALES